MVGVGNDDEFGALRRGPVDVLGVVAGVSVGACREQDGRGAIWSRCAISGKAKNEAGVVAVQAVFELIDRAWYPRSVR